MTTPLTLGGTDPGEFSIQAQPGSAVTSGGGTTTFTVRFTPTSTGAKSATIAIAIANNDSDENPYDLTIEGTSASVDLIITKTTTVTALLVGQEFEYMVEVTNDGPSTATNVVVTDVLPMEFTLISASSSQGTCTGTTALTCALGTIPNQSISTIILRGSANAQGTISNTASVIATETDSSPTNNNSSAPTVAVGPPVPIPTLSSLALFMLGAMLAGIALWVLRP